MGIYIFLWEIENFANISNEVEIVLNRVGFEFLYADIGIIKVCEIDTPPLFFITIKGRFIIRGVKNGFIKIVGIVVRKH